MAIYTYKALDWGATMDRYWVQWCKALGTNSHQPTLYLCNGWLDVENSFGFVIFGAK